MGNLENTNIQEGCQKQYYSTFIVCLQNKKQNKMHKAFVDN